MMRRMFSRVKPKVFCVGANKTGTTSLELALQRLGYRVAPQAQAEMFTEDWALRSFSKLTRFCRRYDAFQDAPFSLSYTYQAMDQAFPGSKFVLSVRRDSETWYASVVSFTSKLLGLDRPATAADLKEFAYRSDPSRRGELWRRHHLVFGVDEPRLFDRATYVAEYERHNEDVRRYFRHRPADLLELRIDEVDALSRLCAFLGVQDPGWAMPHENRSQAEAVS